MWVVRLGAMAALAVVGLVLWPAGRSDAEDVPEVAVSIRQFAFHEQTITVPMGTTVTWTNYDGVAHSATAENGAFDSGYLEKGQTFSFTFTAPGVYGYYCVPHGAPGNGQYGTVIVTEPETSQPEAPQAEEPQQ